MELNANTRLKDIAAAYPWLPETLVKIDSRFGIINNPVGKLLIRTAPLGDVCEMAGYPVETVLEKLKKLIQEHENG